MDQRRILAAPARVPGELTAQSRTLVEVAVAPQMHDLIEGSDLGRPVTFKLAVVILADFARHGARRLHHVADGAGLHRIGSQLIDHGVSLNFFDVGSVPLSGAYKTRKGDQP